jgi:competence protein ComEA
VPEITKPQLAVYAVAAVVIGLLGARYLAHGGGASAGAAPAANGPGRSSPASGVTLRSAGSQPAVVDVTGAVRRPGVVRVHAGARVLEAVRRAGGATPGADLSGVNLAAKVADGAQIVVPRRGQAAAVAGGAAAGTGATAGGLPAAPVNLNTATAAQLDELDGVGPATAQRIVQYRQQHGGFGSVNELDQVPGIGAKKLADLRTKVTV